MNNKNISWKLLTEWNNDIIIIKNIFFINNQLFVNCYKIWHMYRFIIINNKIFIYNLHLLLWFSYIQGVMSAGGFVRRGFYSGGYVRRGFVRRGFYSGGYVRRGLCPRFLKTCLPPPPPQECSRRFVNIKLDHQSPWKLEHVGSSKFMNIHEKSNEWGWTCGIKTT